MRNTILILSLFVCIGLFFAQKPTSNRHVSLKECDNDTLLYIRTNFLQNKQHYIGQKVEKLLNELDFEIRDFHLVPAYIKEFTAKESRGFSFSYLFPVQKYNKNKQKEAYYVIQVCFKSPWHIDSESWRNTGAYWKKIHYDTIKDETIEDILIFKYQYGKDDKLQTTRVVKS